MRECEGNTIINTESINLLDCTLRDGAQVNEARFGEKAINDIVDGLTTANIEIIECGFLKNIEYEEGRTYFPQPSYLEKYIHKKDGTVYAALLDYNRYDVDKLELYNGKSIDLIRISFFEKDICNVKPFIKKVMDKGYKVSIQPMDTFSYSEENIMKIIGVANELNPEALSMVDTYSLATVNDIDRVYSLYERYLNPKVKIGFHSHNNQLNSFALAEHFLEIKKNERGVIIDCSLYGMGRGGGNLNTELFAEFLNREKSKTYNMKSILDMIDRYLVKFKEHFEWGYSMPMLYAGLYGVHVYTVAYLQNKPNVTSYDLKCMFEMLDEHKKKRYDYDYLDGIYNEYMKKRI